MLGIGKLPHLKPMASLSSIGSSRRTFFRTPPVYRKLHSRAWASNAEGSVSRSRRSTCHPRPKRLQVEATRRTRSHAKRAPNGMAKTWFLHTPMYMAALISETKRNPGINNGKERRLPSPIVLPLQKTLLVLHKRGCPWSHVRDLVLIEIGCMRSDICLITQEQDADNVYRKEHPRKHGGDELKD